jgi:zinc protease
MSDKGLLALPVDPAKNLSALAAMDENALSEAWADLGASFSAGAGSDRMSFNLRSLTYPDLLARAMALAAHQIAAPAFPGNVWERDRQRLVASLQEANRRPATIAGRTFAKAVYGNHPYGYELTEETLAAISTSDMAELYRQNILPCRARISIVGAVDRVGAETLALGLLSRLPQNDRCTTMQTVAEVEPLKAAREERVPFESAQAHVFIGQPGYKRDDPDHFALTVGSYTLGGGGFASRLTEAVREKRGLSYSIYSHFSPKLHAGAFAVGLQTRPDQAQQAVALAKEVVAQFVAEGPTEVELQAAKDYMVGGFALLIDSNRKLLDNVANIAWNRLPLDYLETWTQAVNKVTVADVKAAFQRKLQPEKMVTVIVGGAP